MISLGNDKIRKTNLLLPSFWLLLTLLGVTVLSLTSFD